jgi:FAD/FMN-containing dehydrogenase
MTGPKDFAGIWRTDGRARASYSEGAGIYRIVPSAIAVPSTTAALARLVAWAKQGKVSLVPRGAGSAMPGSNVGSGVLVDLRALDGAPLTIDPVGQLAYTGAAVTLGALDELAGRHGLRMPVDPSSARWVTAGGAVSTNASGSRTVRYGSVRRWVHGLDLVTDDGEAVRLVRGEPTPDCDLGRRFREEAEQTLRLARWRVAGGFPKVRKNTAGYALDAYLTSGDLIDLIVGAEGTLGFVTGVTWRLQPIPRARAGVRAALRDVRRLAHVVPALLELDPSRVEFLDGTMVGYLGDDLRAIPQAEAVAAKGALLMVEFEGETSEELATGLERAVGILRGESVEVLLAKDGAEADAIWAIRHAASPRLAQLGEHLRSLQVIEDGCVPVERLGDYLASVRTAAQRAGIVVVMFGHAGDGNVHANLLPDTERNGWRDGVRQVYETVSQAVIAMGGTPSGEHGDGRLRAPLLEKLYGWEIMQLFRLVKRVFDPAGILNPGVKLPLDGPAIASLKVGPDAVPLPVDLERALRRVERDAGYLADRLSLADDPLPTP